MTEEDLQLINDYFDRALTDQQTEAFEKKLKDSEEFSNEVKFQKELLAHTEAHIRSKQKAEMLQDFRSMDKIHEIKPALEKKQYVLMVAATVIFLIGIFSIFNFSGSNTSKVYQAYYKPYDGIVNTRGNELNSDNGLIDYQRGNYNEALKQLLTSTEIEGISEGQRKLLISNCYLSLDQPAESLQYLESIKSDEKSIVIDNADWYRVMSYLKLDQLEQAKKTLNTIANSNSVYAQKAAKLLKEDIFKP